KACALNHVSHQTGNCYIGAGLVKLLVGGKMLSVKPAPTPLDEGYRAFPACEVHLNVGAM
ncbi:MAG: hypothetical protein ACOCXU_07045, partial [Coleofasciculus sp.]